MSKLRLSLLTIMILGVYSPTSWAEDSPVLRLGSVEFVPDFKLYADYQVDLGSQNYDNEFHLSRAYLGMRMQFNSWLGARITYDISQASDIGASGETSGDFGAPVVDDSRVQGSLLARLKYAYLTLGIERLSLDIRMGVMHTPWIDWIEHIEGTRFLRKVMFENEFHYPSADFGAGTRGNVGNYISYFLGLYNGEGYHGVEDSQIKDFIARVSFRPFPNNSHMTGLQISGYTQIEFPWLSNSTDSLHRRYGGAITYRLAEEILSPDCSKVRGDRLALWVQALYSQDTEEGTRTDSIGISAGSRIEFPANLFVITRLDWFDEDISVDTPSDIYLTILGAFGWRPVRQVAIALNYQGRIGEGIDTHLIGINTEVHL